MVLIKKNRKKQLFGIRVSGDEKFTVNNEKRVVWIKTNTRSSAKIHLNVSVLRIQIILSFHLYQNKKQSYTHG